MADPQTGKTEPKILNTLWHGSFAFVPHDDGMDVFTPKLGDHAHYAGSWRNGGLFALPDGAQLKLEGVKGAAPHTAEFDRKHNFFVHADLADDIQEISQSSWRLPHPHRIFTLQRVSILQDNFSREVPFEIQRPGEFGAIQVLTFDLDGRLPSVGGLPQWRPEAREIVNLHIFAEEPYRWAPKAALDHASREFANLLKLTRLGRKSDLEFNFTPGEIPLVEPANPHPAGVRRIELVSLVTARLLSAEQAAAHRTEGVDTGATSGHPCVNVVVKGS